MYKINYDKTLNSNKSFNSILIKANSKLNKTEGFRY